MQPREDAASILPFLPVTLLGSSYFVWPPKALESIKALSLGPDVSVVRSGEVLFDAILDLRESLGIASHGLSPKAAHGYTLFFDELMPREDSRRWFDQVVPTLAGILLRFPALLEDHYGKADTVWDWRKTGLRMFAPEEAGIVFLTQELVAALLVCSLFCLFPTNRRHKNNLPYINFDNLFGGLLPSRKQNQEQKILCLIHYFERIGLHMPLNIVSYERKVLPFSKGSSCVFYPDAGLWKNSNTCLCSFEVSHSGLIEDRKYEAVEVDFANEYLGGGALHQGCVQEEIRFMINPELIAGMLFMPSMGDNEAILIVGFERFSSYTGYASTFRFNGDFMDMTPPDSFGRRMSHIVAIDALCNPGIRQYATEYLLRETNKAFCGFYNDMSHPNNLKDAPNNTSSACTTTETGKEKGIHTQLLYLNYEEKVKLVIYQKIIGIATGNWGCGAFGGDPVLKSIIQWLAASQASRPFILYYTFGEESLSRLEQVTEWILEHKWTVGDLWCMLVEYSSTRLNGKNRDNFFDWLLPVLPSNASADADTMSE